MIATHSPRHHNWGRRFSVSRLTKDRTSRLSLGKRLAAGVTLAWDEPQRYIFLHALRYAN